jgi:hypothetical protein
MMNHPFGHGEQLSVAGCELKTEPAMTPVSYAPFAALPLNLNCAFVFPTNNQQLTTVLN